MLAYSLVIFDYDGTLADSFPWFCSVLNGTAKRFGFREIDPGEIDELRGLGTREIIARLDIPAWKIPMIGVHMRKLSAHSHGQISLFSGATEMLRALKNYGIKIAIVSSNDEGTIRRSLGPATSFIDRFDCSSSLWGKAPKFSHVLKALQVTPQRAIAIGDEVRDIEASRTTGVAAGVVTFGYNTSAALRAHNPDHVFDSYQTLVQKLTSSSAFNKHELTSR